MKESELGTCCVLPGLGIESKYRKREKQKYLLVLSVKYPKVLFSYTSDKNTFFLLYQDMKYEDLRGIIEFIYNGEVSIDQESLSSFLLAAESLKIKGEEIN